MPEKVITPHVRRKAARLAKRITGFARKDPQTGLTHYYVPASDQEPFAPVRAYKVRLDGKACSCLAFWNRGVCSHSIAASLVMPAEE